MGRRGHRRLGISGLPAEQDTGAAINRSGTVFPIGPWGAKRSAPLRRAKKSLWSPDRNLKTVATDFKEAT